MDQFVVLGRTGIKVPKNGFGALPIQRISENDSTHILQKAYENGIRFFDTARGYTDSEKKVGIALSDVREDIVIATKTHAKNVENFWKDLQTSLNLLKTDYIDIYQFHNPESCPKPNDGTGLYEAMIQAKEQGKIKHIGITNHRLQIAEEAVRSGLYETLQFPFSYLADEKDIELVNLCKAENVGFICMKALSGGLITRSDAAYAFLAQYDNALPIWGIQKESELDEFLSYSKNPVEITSEIEEVITQDQGELKGDFCRGCGYCLPCPADIPIPMAARMSLLLRRAPLSAFLTERTTEGMLRIENCIHCDHCVDNCPYGLNTPELLAKNLEDYKTYL